MATKAKGMVTIWHGLKNSISAEMKPDGNCRSHLSPFCSFASARYNELLKMICAPITNANKRARTHRHTSIYTRTHSWNLRISVLRSQQLFSALNFAQRYDYVDWQRFCEQHMCYFKNFNVSIGRVKGRNRRQCISKLCFLAHWNQCVQWAQPGFLGPLFIWVLQFLIFENMSFRHAYRISHLTRIE